MLKRYVGLLGIITVLTISTTAVLYNHWGNFKGVKSHQALVKIDKTLSDELKNPNVNLEQTFERLTEEAEHSAPALARLGELTLQLGWLQKSIDLYEKAIVLDPLNVKTQIECIYAYSLLHQGKLPPDILVRALALSEAQPQAYALTNILAIHAYFSEEYLKAAQQWQNILMSDSSLNNHKRLILEKALSKAKLQLSMRSKSRFKISIAINPALKANLTAGDTLFIAVKAADLDMPPLIVMKCIAQDLPKELLLDDANAMIEVPNYKKIGAVEVIAKLNLQSDVLVKEGIRVSSGKFTVQQGDNPVILNL